MGVRDQLGELVAVADLPGGDAVVEAEEVVVVRHDPAVRRDDEAAGARRRILDDLAELRLRQPDQAVDQRPGG